MYHIVGFTLDAFFLARYQLVRLHLQCNTRIVVSTTVYNAQYISTQSTDLETQVYVKISSKQNSSVVANQSRDQTMLHSATSTANHGGKM